MKKFLSLFAAILFAGSMMAADPVEIANGTFNGKNATYTAGWSTTGTGKSRTDCIIIGANENITSPEVDLSNYESITVQIKARRYGTLSGSKAQIAVTFDGEAIGSTEAAGTSATTALDPIEYTVNGLSTGNFVITCSNATSAGSSHGAGINSIVITGIEKSGEGGGEQEGTVKTLYCKVAQDWWKTDGAAVGIYAFKGETKNAEWPGVRMTAVEGETDLWKADIDTALYSTVIFVRVSGTGDIADYGAKTGDLAIPADKDLYTITSTAAVWGDPGVAGEWSVYVAPVPVENVTIYCVNTNEWETVNAFVWPETGSAYKEWPGEAMTKTENQIHGFDVYSYTFPENYVKIIFNNGEEQTADLTWDAAKPYFYDGKWYESADKIPAPAVPVEGNIWKAIATTPVLAGSHYIDEELIKMDGVYATTLKANARTIAGEEFTHAIQVRTDGYPSATNVIGNEKSGNTPLIITAKENIEVTFYYNRQAINASGTENDNKDLIVFDQAAPTVKMEGDFVIDQILSGNEYLNATKKVMLEKDHVYTVTASGTTIQLHGVKFGIPVPHYYIAGTMTDWAAHMVEMEAGNVDTFHVALAMEADSLYSFKVVKILGTDTTWYGNEEEGTMVYGNSTGWWLKGQVDVALQTTKAGEYEFIFKANENNEISVVIPEPAKEYYAKYAPAWEWVKMTEEEGLWLTDTIVYKGIGININDKADNANNMFYSNTVEEEGVRPIAGAEIAENDTILFSFNPADSVVTAVMVGKYVAPVPHYYIAGTMTDWAAHMVEMEAGNVDTFHVALALEADSLYAFKVVRVQGTDTAWYGLGEAATMEYGNSTGWWLKGEANIGLQTTKAGEYEFIFKANENNEISVVIPEPAKKYYAKYAPKWEWSMLTEKEGLWLTDTIVYGGIGININDAAADENNMFYSNTVEEEGVRAIAGAAIEVNDTIYFSFNPADSVVTAVMVGKYVAPVSHYYIAGTMTDWAAHMVEMEAGNVDTFHVALALEADSLYSFKVVKILGTDTTWYGNGEEATMEYGNSTGWWLKGDVDVKLQTTKAGEYEFIFKSNENNEISVVIPEPAKKYYAKYAPAWAWSMMTEKEGLWLTDTIVYKGIGININDKADDENNMFYSNTVKEEGVRPIAGAEIAENDTVLFSFNPADSVVTAIMVGKYVPQLPVVGFGANFNGWNWPENLFVPAEDNLSASFKITLGVTDTIEFKIVSDGSWLSLNGEGESLYGLHRNWPKAEHVNIINDGRNFSLTTDVAGEYIFTWTYADSTLVVTFPEAPVDPTEHTYTVAGNLADAFGTSWEPANAANDMVKQEDGTYKWEKADLTLAAGEIKFKVCKDHSWAVAYPAGDYVLNIAEQGVYTITITYNPADNNAVNAVAQKTGDAEVTVNYYLVGSVKGWEAKAENIFTLNAEAGEGIEEYVIETTLAVGEGLKVLSSTGTWYPDGMDNEYKVDQNHAGTTTIYFRPAYNEEWAAFGGYIYVVPTDPTALDEIMAAGKAVKIVRNGQILIIKGEKIFNAQGQLVK